MSVRRRSGIARTLFLDEGESTRVTFGEVGRWRFRLVLVTQDLCEPGTLDAVLLQDGQIDVVAGP
ncbi:MAG: hypothetical protein ACC662_02765 [Planctomycetota bacterium]